MTPADFGVAQTRVRPSAMREVAIEVRCFRRPPGRPACCAGTCSCTTSQQPGPLNQRSLSLAKEVMPRALQSAGHRHMQPTAQHGCGACLAFSVHVACMACADGAPLVQVPRVTWADVGGLDDVKLRLQEAVQWPHLHPEALERLGALPPQGDTLHCLLRDATRKVHIRTVKIDSRACAGQAGSCPPQSPVTLLLHCCTVRLCCL